MLSIRIQNILLLVSFGIALTLSFGASAQGHGDEAQCLDLVQDEIDTTVNYGFAALSEDGKSAFGFELAEIAPQILRYAVRLTGDRTKGQDLAQTALATAWENQSQFAPGSKLLAWVRVITKNLHFSSLRSGQPEIAFAPEDMEFLPRLVSSPNQHDRLILRDLERAWQKLTPVQQEILGLASFADLSYDEIANRVGIPPSTVASHIFKARKKLDALLQGHSAKEELPTSEPTKQKRKLPPGFPQRLQFADFDLKLEEKTLQTKQGLLKLNFFQTYMLLSLFDHPEGLSQSDRLVLMIQAGRKADPKYPLRVLVELGVVLQHHLHLEEPAILHNRGQNIIFSPSFRELFLKSQPPVWERVSPDR